MTLDKTNSTYTASEEMANIITHGIGVLLSIVALWLMVVYALRDFDATHVIAVSIFGGTLILLYLMSTLYHSFRDPELKQLFRVLDHSSIYLLIAGSYTPFTLVYLEGAWAWIVMSITWTLAVSGVVFKIFFIKRFHLLSTAMYVAMGWTVLIAIKPLIEATPTGAMVWLTVGGLLYTGGVVFYLWNKLPYNHAIWHLFVMGGSFSHFCAVFLYILDPVVAAA
ncbi:MAG: hemolysin III family protein [Candidatus Hydrogenedentota bacterium]